MKVNRKNKSFLNVNYANFLLLLYKGYSQNCTISNLTPMPSIVPVAPSKSKPKNADIKAIV